MRTAPTQFRAVWAMMLALVLAMRLVTPAGFMPSFGGGRLTVVECPGSGPMPMMPMSGMDHNQKKLCQSCPHATATGAGLVDAQPLLLTATTFATVSHSIASAFALSLRRGQHERPPAIGPPIPA
jgi:hypothetical protein